MFCNRQNVLFVYYASVLLCGVSLLSFHKTKYKAAHKNKTRQISNLLSSGNIPLLFASLNRKPDYVTGCNCELSHQNLYRPLTRPFSSFLPQAQASVSYRDTMPIRPATNQVLWPRIPNHSLVNPRASLGSCGSHPH